MFTLDAHDFDALDAMAETLDNSEIPTLADGDTLNFLARVIRQTEKGENTNQTLYNAAKLIFTGVDAATVARSINLAARNFRKEGTYIFWED